MDDKMSEAMDDLEMVRRCAEAMGYEVSNADLDKFHESGLWCYDPHAVWRQHSFWYRPHRSDTYGNAQAMALVKRLNLEIRRPHSDEWWVMGNGLYGASVGDADLNRAIVRCVAAMFGEK